MVFSEKVRTARSELRMTQLELAKATQLSLRTILAYERGEKFPRQGALLRLADALHVSTKFLSDDECDNPMEDIARDGYIARAREAGGGPRTAADVAVLMEQNRALFAGGDLTEEQKDEFFRALMAAYLACKDDAKKKYGTKKK